MFALNNTLIGAFTLLDTRIVFKMYGSHNETKISHAVLSIYNQGVVPDITAVRHQTSYADATALEINAYTIKSISS